MYTSCGRTLNVSKRQGGGEGSRVRVSVLIAYYIVIKVFNCQKKIRFLV